MMLRRHPLSSLRGQWAYAIDVDIDEVVDGIDSDDEEEHIPYENIFSGALRLEDNDKEYMYICCVLVIIMLILRYMVLMPM